MLALPYFWLVRLLVQRLARMEAQSVVLPLVPVLSLAQGLARLERLLLVASEVQPQAPVFCLGLAMEHRVLALGE